MGLDDIKRVAVVGAGLMGHGIAQIYAEAGYDVRLVDTREAELDRAKTRIRACLATIGKKGLVSEEEGNLCMTRIRFTTNLSDAVSDADLVVEAVPEVAEIKTDVYRKLDAFCGPETLFHTNTSGLDVFRLVPEKRAVRLVATHFFAPARIIPLVEVCPGPVTDKNALCLTKSLLRKVGKQPLVMKQFVPSFIVNRIQNYISMAVFEMLSNNWATPAEIDIAVKYSLGIRLPIVGVVQSLDFTGLDLVQDIIAGTGISIPLIDDLVKQGRLGAKTSKGFYDYDGRSEEAIVEKRDLRYLEIAEFLEKTGAHQSI
ncbi:MAG: 3-hydroxyacyl-CoA dehydrogenase family protein [Desulfobacteraceae bacterium]|jgi:3-hydroxyacyl-CoA dehydrogenase